MTMDVVSYRGPGAAGGVSSALEIGWRNQSHIQSHWWFLANNTIERLSSEYRSGMFVKKLPEELVSGHYRYCNDFLWPLMHDLPQYATFNAGDRDLYREFNIRFADHIAHEHKSENRYFVQDYQLAILPRFLNLLGGASEVFWHIPWPKNVPPEFICPLAEIARSLLRADILGFHAREYAQNFLQFVWQCLPDYSTDASGMRVSRIRLDKVDFARRRIEGNRRGPLLQELSQGSNTKIVVQPLGINTDHWANLATAPVNVVLPSTVTNRFVLSVDRVDYTKSVAERMRIVDRFFQRYPEMIGKVTFVQVCGRTRPGLAAFDEYWRECQEQFNCVNNAWKTDSWEPIYWLDKPLSSAQLASLYQRAAVMLVNPVRDGLNLTAKEFVACQNAEPGVLLLSSGAGAWHELGSYALNANPLQPDLVVENLARALTMGTPEKQLRMDLMRSEVERNPMDQWWSFFSRLSLVGSEHSNGVDCMKMLA